MSVDSQSLPDFNEMRKQLDRLNATARTADEPLPEPSVEDA
ncbi:hypothetical protein ACFQE1_10950 [Halobium palmae]|uniref:Uncharacterized protein n=1 Tax=Halobium palmae TaxID=1776492 RepID=A0ABD5S0T7_9EURY